MARKAAAVPPTKTLTPTVQVPRTLAEQTVGILIQLPVKDVYTLVKSWEDAVPGLLASGGDST